jgi:hypothetical protein
VEPSLPIGNEWGPVAVGNSTFSNNTASTGAGGAIINYNPNDEFSNVNLAALQFRRRSRDRRLASNSSCSGSILARIVSPSAPRWS